MCILRHIPNAFIDFIYFSLLFSCNPAPSPHLTWHSDLILGPSHWAPSASSASEYQLLEYTMLACFLPDPHVYSSQCQEHSLHFLPHLGQLPAAFFLVLCPRFNSVPLWQLPITGIHQGAYLVVLGVLKTMSLLRLFSWLLFPAPNHCLIPSTIISCRINGLWGNRRGLQSWFLLWTLPDRIAQDESRDVPRGHRWTSSRGYISFVLLKYKYFFVILVKSGFLFGVFFFSFAIFLSCKWGNKEQKS